MAGKTYSAGTIFLQVVPVFGNLQRDIEREVKDADKVLRDETEKSAKKAGRRAGEVLGLEMTEGAKGSGRKAAEAYVGEFDDTLKKGIEKTRRELKPIKINVERNELRKEFSAIKRELEALDKDVKLGLDSKSAHAALTALDARLKKLFDESRDIRVKTNLDEAQKGLAGFITRIERANPELKVDLDTKPAERQLGAFEKKFQKVAKAAAAALGDAIDPEVARLKRRLDNIGNAKIGVDVTSREALAELDEIDRRLLEIGMTSVEPDIDVNTTVARAELAALRKALAAVDGRDVDVKVDVKTGAAAAQLGLLTMLLGSTGTALTRAGGASENAANSFRSFNWRVLAAVSLIPPLIPMVAALGGALIALAPAAAAGAAGLGVFILGLSGISDAVKAMGDVENDAVKDSHSNAKKMEDAAERISDAQRNLTRAREDAAERNSDAARAVARAEQDSARQVQDALRRHADAERALADAQRDATEAQQALREARKQAQQDLDDIADRSRQNALDIRQAQIDLFEAQAEYDAAIADPASTNLEKEQLSINLGNAKERLHELREEEDELQKTRKKGVAGNAGVQSAQDALTAALERQRDAQRAVGEAARAVAQARIDGAERVADAVRQQQRAEEDGAEQVSDAQRALVRAQQDYQDALYETEVVGTSSMQKLEEAMGKLSPAGRRFARFIYGLRHEFYLLRAAAQENMLPGLQTAIENMVNFYGPSFRRFVGDMAKTLGDFFVYASEVFRNDTWRDFFGMLADIGPSLVETFGKSTLNVMGFFAELLTLAAPYAERLANGILRMSEAALKWIDSQSGQDTMTAFMDYAFKVGPKVLKFLGAFFDALTNLLVAATPWGEAMLTLFTEIFQFIGDMDPKLLGAIASAAFGLAMAFQLAVGAVAILLGGLAVFAFPISKFIFIIGMAITAIVILYTQSETFRDIVNGVFEAIGKVISWVWNEVIKPIFEGFAWYFGKVAGNIQSAWEGELKPVWGALARVMTWLWEKIFKPYLGYIGRQWDRLSKGIAWVFKNILWPVFDLLGTLVWKTLWLGMLKPAFWAIKTWWRLLADSMEWVWEKLIAPVLNALGIGVSKDLKQAFRDAVDGIKSIWDSLVEIVGRPIRFVIETVLNNGLIKGFNAVADFVGSDKIPNIPVPQWTYGGNTGKQPNQTASRPGIQAATGAVLPGWTPGRDVHRFVSPTGGTLDLSGGEAVMRPEWTAAMGPDYVHWANRIARLEGVAGLRKRLQGGGLAYARGGITPAPGSWNQHTSGYPWATWSGDINVPGPGDYGNIVRAFKEGVVAAVQHLTTSYGTHVRINHPDGSQTLYAHLSSENVSVGQRVAAGQMIGRVGSTGNSSGPHLHFEIKNGHFAGAPAGAGEGENSGLPGWLERIIGKPLDWAKGLLSKGMELVTDKFGDSPLFQVIHGLGTKLLSPMIDKIMSWFAGGTEDPDNLGISGDIPDNAVRQAVQAVAARYGWAKGDQWEALAEIVRRESSWDPNAANPTSSARGLFQKMTSIHGPLEGTVEGQALWGLNYIRSRYGNPMNALMHHNSKGWYADGGIIGEQSGASTGLADNGTMMYDNGGYLPPGLTTVVNLTGKPEPVFTADQFEKIGSGGSGFTYAPHFDGSDLTAADVMDDFLFTYRRIEHGGKYIGARD